MNLTQINEARRWGHDPLFAEATPLRLPSVRQNVSTLLYDILGVTDEVEGVVGHYLSFSATPFLPRRH